MKIAISIIALVSLVGCAATTPQQARNMGPEHRHVFEVDSDYQVVYRRILENARHCQSGWMITATMQVTGDLYPDTRSGTITASLNGFFGPSIVDVVDVRGLDGGNTEVTVVFPNGRADTLGKTIESWSRIDGASC